MLGDAGPAVALVGTGVKRARSRAEVDAGRFQLIGGHGLAQDAEERIGLRQALPMGAPGLAAVSRSPHRRLGVGHVTASGVTIERYEVKALRIARMGGGRKAEARRQTGLDALPAASAVVAAIHAAVVLLIKTARRSGRHHQAVHALAGLGIVLPLGQEIGPRP